MPYSTILHSVSDGVATLVFNRPERMNAIDATMYDEVLDAVGRAAADPAVRVLLLTGAGDRAFCAGADLQARGSDKPTDPARVRERNVHPERALNGVLLGFEKPIIAAVNGVAAGGGLSKALVADIIIASDTARFGTAHVKLAMPLLDMLGFLLPRRIGPGRAADLAFTGRLVGAAEALAIGLADRVVPAAELMSAATALATEIAANAPLSLHFSKQAIRRADPETHERYALFERHIFNVCFNSEDAKEAMRARREKRKPVFKGC